jgi:hypothetical protein
MILVDWLAILVNHLAVSLRGKYNQTVLVSLLLLTRATARMGR